MTARSIYLGRGLAPFPLGFILLRGFLGACLWLGALAPASAQQPQHPESRSSEAQDASPRPVPPDLLRASELIGMQATTRDNQPIGEIEDVLIGEDGRVNSALVDLGGFLGVGERRVRVQWSQIRMNQEENRLVLNLDQNQLAALPESAPDPITPEPSAENEGGGKE